MSGHRNRPSRANKKPTVLQHETKTTTDDIISNGSGQIERSASVVPTSSQSMKTLTTDPTCISRSKSAYQVNQRRMLCSAVLDSAELTPIARPDKGGSKGQKISVYTNHFPVNYTDKTVYQYDIEICMVGHDGKLHVAPKDDRWEVVQTIIKQQKDFPLVWYDEGKTLYTAEILPNIDVPISIHLRTGNEKKLFSLTKLNLVRQDKIGNLDEFINGETNIRPSEIVHILETLFKQRVRNDFLCIRNQFYDRHRQLNDLGDGRGMAKGFYQSLFLTQMGPTLNMNLAFTCFYMPLSFIEFASKYLRKDITNGIHEWEIKAFQKLVRNLSIGTMHTGRRIFYRLREFGRPANVLMFTRTDEEVAKDATCKEISVAEYFEKKYKKKLRFPSLPCINGAKGNQSKPNWLPMEVVHVAEWQRALKPLDKSQRTTVSKNTILQPVQRYNEIMNIVRNNQFNRDPYLQAMNISVQDQEMAQIEARVLAPPEITYHRSGNAESSEYVKFGQWRIRDWFYGAVSINSWGIIYFGDKPDMQVNHTLNNFKSQLPNLLRSKGFQIKGDLSLEIKDTTENDIESTLHVASQKKWTLTIVILNSNNSDRVYSLVKSFAHKKLGLMTQCVNYQALSRNISKLHMYVDNISQKINGKLGGINGVLNLRSALYFSSRQDLFMFFGADVTHSTCSSDRPSIAAVVGSRDFTNSRYAARLCEQYPRKGRCSVEIIKDLDRLVIDLIKVFSNSCGNRLPNKLIFYRDGVDEGQNQKVLDNEVNKIKHACRIVYGNGSLPQLTFIVVKKRHNTRFFLYDGNQTSNVEAGTVIDTRITHPSQFDFYLCSQNARMGTSRPALYHVLHDDNKFTSDAIQQLTYWLCHTDMRCTKSVSIPAPVHYAHLAAYGSRVIKFGEDHDKESIDENNDAQEDYSLDNIKTKLLELDEKVADDMWFL